MESNLEKFIQAFSPDGGFLQSDHWRRFQDNFGRKTFSLRQEDGQPVAFANIVTHNLPIVGDYFYVPRGPILIQNSKFTIQNYNTKLKSFLNDLLEFAKKENIGWIRVEPSNAEILELIKDNLQKGIELKKASVDMQPREILVIDISRDDEEILAQMKQKTRYNIKLSRKRGVSVKAISNFQFPISKKYIDEFLRLVNITAKRDRIATHPEGYYRKMFETIPPEILRLYIAEYEGKIIAANLVLFFGKTATYMHGASDNEHRSLMSPYLLQWRAIQEAKTVGCEKYDFGGVDTQFKKLIGITKFKTGFAPETKTTKFPGSYDIILKPGRYNLYRILQKIKRIL
jgi:peptidoglycan pentaglycine glycine transferase (the first glycine)